MPGTGVGTPAPEPWGIGRRRAELGRSVTTHAYGHAGTYAVVQRPQLPGRNRSYDAARDLGRRSNNVSEFLPFGAQGCGETYCGFSRGEEIGFTVETNAPPDLYLYGWDADGTIDHSSTKPLSHAYPTFGAAWQQAPSCTRGSFSSTESDLRGRCQRRWRRCYLQVLEHRWGETRFALNVFSQCRGMGVPAVHR